MASNILLLLLFQRADFSVMIFDQPPLSFAVVVVYVLGLQNPSPLCNLLPVRYLNSRLWKNSQSAGDHCSNVCINV